jgi:hypothetical protein
MEPVTLSTAHGQRLRCAIPGVRTKSIPLKNKAVRVICRNLFALCSISLLSIPLTASSNGCFASPVNYTGFYTPYDVAVGDFNKDGKLDLVVADGSGGTLYVLLGNGDGTFQPPTPLSSGGYPWAVAVGDFNGDGKLDIAAANLNNPGSVGILLGNGDGTFQAVKTFAAGINAASIAVGDFNGDGKLDVVVSNEYSTATLSILLGNGDGTLGAATTYTLPNGYTLSVTAADLNGDGKLDVADSNSDVLLGNGNGTFGMAVNYNSGNGVGPKSVVTGDFNHDGKLDIAIASYGNNSLSILLGNGNGTFQPPVYYPTGSGSSYGAQSLTAADFNKDGNLDIAVGVVGGKSVSVFLGNGDGTFLQPAIFPVGNNPWSVASADVNGDGYPDLVTANFSGSNVGNYVSVLLNTPCDASYFTLSAPSATPAGSPINVTVTAFNPYHQTATNYTGMVHFTSTDPQAVLPADSTLTNGVGTFAVTLKSSGNQTVTVTDTVAASTTGSATVSVSPGPTVGFAVTVPVRRTPGVAFDFKVRAVDQFQNTTPSYWTTSPKVHFTSSDPQASLPADYIFKASDAGMHTFSNGATLQTQGTQTITATDTVNNSITGSGAILIAPPAGCLPSMTSYNADSNPYAIAAGDFRHNGKKDLVVVNYSSNDVSVFLGNGDGTFQPAVNYAVGKSPVAIGVGDFNGDGKLDIVTVNLTDTNLSVLLGNGDGTFQAAKNTPLAALSNPRGLAVGDFNGDGKLDVAVSFSGSHYLTVRIMAGNGDGTFSIGPSVAAGSFPEFVIAGDFNGDGALDFAVADYGSNIITVAINNGSGSFPVTHTYAVGSSSTSAPSSIAVGDFNRDGKLDLAVANFNDNKVSVLLGNGDGTFQNAVNYAVGVSPTSVIAADFYGDGYADLAVANSDPFSFNPGSVSILLGNGAGSFQAPMNFTVGLQPYSLVAADFNGDNIMDFAVANENSAGNGNVGVSLNQVCPVTHLGVTGPASTTVGASFTIGVTAFNDYNRVAAGYNGLVFFTSSDGGAQLPLPYNFVPADNGSHTFVNAAILRTAGSQLVISRDDANHSIYGASSITVNQATTNTALALTSGNSPSTYGQALTFTATVSPQFSGTPTGTVTFFDGGNSLGTGTPAGAGAWTLSTSALAGGSHTMTASYGGNANFQSSGSPGLMQNVNRAQTNVTLVVSPIPFRFRQSVPYSATVSPSTPTPAMPTGTVNFMDGAGTVGTGTVDVSGHATFHTNQFTIGAHVITVVYAGDTNFSGNSSAPVRFNRSPKPR